MSEMNNENKSTQILQKIFYTFNHKIFSSIKNAFKSNCPCATNLANASIFSLETEKIAVIYVEKGEYVNDIINNFCYSIGFSIKYSRNLTEVRAGIERIENLEIFFLDFCFCEREDDIRNIFYSSETMAQDMDYLWANKKSVANLAELKISFENSEKIKTVVKSCKHIQLLTDSNRSKQIEEDKKQGRRQTTNITHTVFSGKNQGLYSFCTNCIVVELAKNEKSEYTHDIMLDRLGSVCLYLCGKN